MVLDGVGELEKVIDCATRIDLDFVDRYEAIRPTRPRLSEEFEDNRSELILQERSVLPGPQAAALAAAAHLWVEVEYVVPNRGKHEEGNQIDMQRGTRVFFGFGDGAVRGTLRLEVFGFCMRRTPLQEICDSETTPWTSLTSRFPQWKVRQPTATRRCSLQGSPAIPSALRLEHRVTSRHGRQNPRPLAPYSQCAVVANSGCSEISGEKRQTENVSEEFSR